MEGLQTWSGPDVKAWLQAQPALASYAEKVLEVGVQPSCQP